MINNFRVQSLQGSCGQVSEKGTSEEVIRSVYGAHIQSNYRKSKLSQLILKARVTLKLSKLDTYKSASFDEFIYFLDLDLNSYQFEAIVNHIK